MTTSVHRDAQRPAQQNRRVVLALLASLLLHTPLFLSPGAWQFGSPSETTSPAPEVRIELHDGKASDDTPREDALAEVQELLAAVPEPGDVPAPSDLLAESIDERIIDAGPQLEPPEVPTPSESPTLHDSAFADATALDNPDHDYPDELTSVQPELANELAPRTEAVVATLAPAQGAVLTRRLAREARELLDSREALRHLTFTDKNREFTAVLTRHPAADGTGIERMTAEITTEQGGERIQTTLQMKRLAFSHFTHLVDRWDPNVQLHDDEIAGRFHSNSELALTYDHKVAPRLLGTVTTTRGIRITGEKGWRRRSEIFAGGVATRTPRVRLPEISLPVAHERATRNADIHLVRSDTLVVFSADGGYDCIELTSRTAARRRLAPERPAYIIGLSDTELHVRGVVNGKVTVYSPERIVVAGDLTYAHDPRTDDNADAVLGLMSNGNVEIARAAEIGPGDLEIHAAVYARNRFVVRNAHARGGATLIIYGSLTAGSVSETEPRYATRIEFDPRFEHSRPPGFPETDRYEIEAWDGRWRLAETSVHE